MKTIEIFEEAMCCPTGLCGAGINTDLLRISTVTDTLKRKGINISRHNLKEEPQLYVSNNTVNDFLMKNGVEGLPVTLIDGEIVVSKTYPTTKQLGEWTGINLNYIPVR